MNANKPIAWIWSEDGCNMGVCLDQDKQIGKQEFQDYSIPLYTHPAELTDEQINIVGIKTLGSIWNCYEEELVEFARAIFLKAQET